MNFLRFIFGLPQKDKTVTLHTQHIKEGELVESIETSYKVWLYTPIGLEEYLVNEEPYCDDGGSLQFTTNDGKEHWYSGTWKYQEL